jgi:hypothetical protein
MVRTTIRRRRRGAIGWIAEEIPIIHTVSSLGIDATCGTELAPEMSDVTELSYVIGRSEGWFAAIANAVDGSALTSYGNRTFEGSSAGPAWSRGRVGIFAMGVEAGGRRDAGVSGANRLANGFGVGVFVSLVV